MSEQEIFLAAIEISDLAGRRSFLDKVCTGNSTLRQQVESLLKVHATAGDFLAMPAMQQLSDKSKTIDNRSVQVSLSSKELEKTCGYSQDPQLQDEQVSLGFLSSSTKPGSLGHLGHYEVTEVLGHGAFGIVLKAFDEKLHRTVAIKVMSQELASASPPRKRFLREARASAAIRHENVVTVYAVEETPIPYLVMEHVPGLTLHRLLSEHGPLDVPDVLRLGQQIASGLAAAHAQGLIHRDIKPANILLENGVSGQVKITDFGLARAADDASLTQSGLIAGTPMYMSPEQASSGVIDLRSDLFSLGSVLYVMISGRPPFRAGTMLAVIKRVVEDNPRPIPEIIADVPSWLCAIIAKLQAKEPANRFSSANEVANLLGQCLTDLQANREVSLPKDLMPVPSLAMTPGSPESVVLRQELAKPIRRDGIGRRWLTAAAIFPLLFVGLGYTEATGVTKLTSTVIRLTTGSGTLVIETDEPGVKVTIDGEDVRIQGTGVEEFSLKPGKYEVAAIKDGKSVLQHLVTIVRGGREVVRVTLVGLGTATAAAATQNNVRGHDWPTNAPKPAIIPFDVAQAKKYQEEWAAYLKVPLEYENSIGMKFRLIPPGEFLMGSTTADIEAALLVPGDNRLEREFIRSEGPQHKVALTQPYYLGAYEVTQQEYDRVSGDNPSRFSAKGGGKVAVIGMDTTHFPVERVNWNDAAEFCSKLSLRENLKPFYFRASETVTPLEGNGYRLPTEAEWEFACAAGTTSKLRIGELDDDVIRVAWTNINSGGRTHAVGELKANPFGLFDIAGNVWEWVQDTWEPTYYEQLAGTALAVNPCNSASRNSRRVIRGGGFTYGPFNCRFSHRFSNERWERHGNCGFRIALTIDAVKKMESERNADTN